MKIKKIIQVKMSNNKSILKINKDYRLKLENKITISFGNKKGFYQAVIKVKIVINDMFSQLICLHVTKNKN